MGSFWGVEITMLVRARQIWLRRIAVAAAAFASLVLVVGATPRPAAAQYYGGYGGYPGYAYPYPYYPYNPYYAYYPYYYPSWYGGYWPVGISVGWGWGWGGWGGGHGSWGGGGSGGHH